MRLKRERGMFKGRGKRILEREGHKCNQRAGAPLLWKQAERAVHPGEKFQGNRRANLQYLKDGYKRVGEGLFTGYEVTGQGEMTLH